MTRVYVQTFIPGGRPIPVLLATTSTDELLRLRLTREGWVPFGQPLQSGAVGEVRSGLDRLQVVANGRVLLDHLLDPVTPDGWWTAVDALGSHCVVVLAREGSVDLGGPDAAERLSGLLGTEQAMSAALPVVTDLTG